MNVSNAKGNSTFSSNKQFFYHCILRARTNCDVFLLKKEDLDVVLQAYPRLKRKILKIAKERMESSQTIMEHHASWRPQFVREVKETVHLFH